MADSKATSTYYDELKKILSGNEYGSINNDERYHNAEILRLFLEEGGNIRMFCGEMSVFRKGFYAHITEERGVDDAKFIKGIIEDRLTKFFESTENSIEIILARPIRFSEMSDLLCDSLLWNKLNTPALSIKVGNEWVQKAKTLDHFMYSDKRIMRLEDDAVNHKGYFAANIPPKFYKEIEETYEVIRKDATAIAF
ncbi:MAG: hypothetical protein HDS67_05435 [Bacteroidales bacterium]|nr:hypothetical protein [Bacteroidales bacterium]